MLASLPSNRHSATRSYDAVRRIMALLPALVMVAALAPPASWLRQKAVEQAPPASVPLPATPAALDYALPPELAGKSEVAEARTMHSRTFAMGDGSYGLLQDSMPLHYQAEDSAWQPINPAFAAVPEGWLNQTNTFQTGIDRRSSQAKVGTTAVATGWQPEALLITDSEGQSTSVAQPLVSGVSPPGLRSADGRTVRYTKNWSSPGVADQWHTGAGAAEYAMRLPALPQTAAADPRSLDLQVRLELLPGTTIEVDGKPAVLPLETNGVITFVGKDGAALELLPPRTFEQRAPEQAVAGSYALQGTADPQQIELRVRTPWSWLAAPERRFPAIIDPLFQMRSATMLKIANYNPSTQEYLAGANLNFSFGKVGRFKSETKRTLVRFESPRMPPNTEVTKAYLLAKPTEVNHSKDPDGAATFDFDRTGLETNVFVHELTSPNWFDQQNQSKEPQFDINAPVGGPQTAAFSRGENIISTTKWDITPLASKWKWTTPTAPSNYGLLLRTEDEFCAPEYVTSGDGKTHQNPQCGGFWFGGAGKGDNWTSADLAETQASSPNVVLPITSESGGLRLLVFYNGAPLQLNTKVELPAPNGQDPYFHADHVYGVPPLPTNPPGWRAVVARSFGPTQGVYPLTQIGQLYKEPLQGAVPMSLRTGNDVDLVAAIPPTAGDVQYALMNGRTVVGADPNRSYQLHLAPTADSPPPQRYDVRIIGEAQNQIAPNNGTEVRHYEFASADPLALWNLVLPQGTNNRVVVNITGVNTGPQSYLSYAEHFSPRIYRSASQSDLAFSAGADGPFRTLTTDKVIVPDSAPGAPGMVFKGQGFTAQAGQYALALGYSGPGLTVREILPCEGEICGDEPVEVVPIKFGVRIQVTSCLAGSFPTADGACQLVRCPNSVTFPSNANPNNYRVASGWGLWSVSGWSSGDPIATSSTDNASSVAPMLGPPANLGLRQPPRVAIVGGTIAYNTGSNSVTLSGDSIVMLVQCPAFNSSSSQPPSAWFEVFQGGMQREFVNGTALLRRSAANNPPLADPWPGSDRAAGDLTGESFRVNPVAGTALGAANLRRVMAGDQAGQAVNLSFPTSWSWNVDGWSSLDGSVQGNGSNLLLPIAGLEPSLGATFDIDTDPANGATPRLFRAVRATAGTIKQPDMLGGASRPVQIVVLPRGAYLPSDPASQCEVKSAQENTPGAPASCVDLRGPADAANLPEPERTWQMPPFQTDMEAGSVMLNRPGEMMMWSNDHPLAGAAGLPNSFSYKGDNLEVTVELEPCEVGGPIAAVAKGKGKLGAPNVGDGASPTLALDVAFKMCTFGLEAPKLRNVKIAFQSSTGIPMGTSGLYLNGLTGEITINPDYTTAVLGVSYQSLPNSPGVAAGTGTVTIDTRGLFAVQAKAKILGELDGSAGLWVAWNPLDIGITARLSYKDWLTGDLRAHMWRGQGFQNKFNWLPDNDEIHIAAAMSAQIHIKKGDIGTWWSMSLPPFDVDLGIEVAFGQFCTNATCSAYEYGIKGKVFVSGFEFGMYYSFDSGFDWIWGNDGHVLIDQHGGANPGPVGLQAGAEAVPLEAAPPVVDGAALVPVTVSPNAEQLLFMLGWQAGAPRLSLINPNGVEITPANAASEGVQLENTGTATLLTVQSPLPGQWQAKIANLSQAGVEHYTFMYLANKGAPGTPQQRGRFLAPAAADEQGVGSYTITWEAPAGTSPKSTISLYYTRVESVVPEQPVFPDLPAPNVEQDVPIVKNLPFVAGSYLWNTVGLASGSYRLRAEVDDGINDAGLVSRPNDTCVPLASALPSARAFDAERFPGVSVFSSTGTVRIDDTAAPPVPTGLDITPLGGALMARWAPSPAADVASYLLRWGPRVAHADSFVVQNQERIAAATGHATKISTVTNGKEYGIEVLAVDASGNVSPATAPIFARPDANVESQPEAPGNLQLTGKTSASASVSWNATAHAASYRVTYTRLGAQPVVGEQTTTSPGATITDLTPGATYDIAVQALSGKGWASPASEALQIVVTDGADANGDGLPDDWAQAYGVADAPADADGDGLTNGAELTAGANPVLQDTDGDAFGDGEEQAGNTNPLQAASYPAEFAQPRLALGNDELHFLAKRTDAGVAPQSIDWRNVGGGALNLAASSTSPWITTDVGGEAIQFDVNPSGLQPGFYSGVVQLRNAAGVWLMGESSCVRVNLWLLPADNDVPPPTNTPTPTVPPATPTPPQPTPSNEPVPGPSYQLYLPAVRR